MIDGVGTGGAANPLTHQLSFYGSSYSSTFLDFVPLELEDRNHKPLQSPILHQICEWCTGVHLLFLATFVLALRRFQQS